MAILLSIVSSSVLLVLFKYFAQYGVKTFQAITVNYIVAAALGFAMSGQGPTLRIVESSWIGFACLLGTMFIIMFYIMALSAQKVGVAVSTVANKMSLVIPVVAGVLLYSESVGAMKLVGIIGSVIAVAMVVWPNSNIGFDKRFLILPVIIFVGSGALDTMFKYCQNNLLHESEFSLFSATLFGVSATVGSLTLAGQAALGRTKLEVKSLIAGILLGVPNYFSIFFLLKALDIPGFESTMVFPVNNVGIVLLSTLLAILLFREHLSNLNRIGILLAVISIVLIATQ